MDFFSLTDSCRRTRRQDIRNGDPLTHCSDLQHPGELEFVRATHTAILMRPGGHGRNQAADQTPDFCLLEIYRKKVIPIPKFFAF